MPDAQTYIQFPITIHKNTHTHLQSLNWRPYNSMLYITLKNLFRDSEKSYLMKKNPACSLVLRMAMKAFFPLRFVSIKMNFEKKRILLRGWYLKYF